MATVQKSSIAHLATDPLRNFKFRAIVQQTAYQDPRLAGFAHMGFMSVSGLNITTEVIAYREGGMNTTTQKMPGQSDFAPITLTKGLAVGDGAMWGWMSQLFTVMQGTGAGNAGGDFRHILDIEVLDHPVTRGKAPIKARFRVYNAWPTAVAFSDLDAGANAIIVQQMTLAHEGFDMRIANTIGSSEPPRF